MAYFNNRLWDYNRFIMNTEPNITLFGSSRERFYFRNNLLALVKALENTYTNVDLRSDHFVNGKIANVDGFMNITMEDAVFTDTHGKQYYFESFFIQARNIRYVHIPEQMPIVQTIQQHLTKMNPPKKTQPKPFGHKARMVLKKHQSTLHEIYGKKT